MTRVYFLAFSPRRPEPSLTARLATPGKDRARYRPACALSHAGHGRPGARPGPPRVRPAGGSAIVGDRASHRREEILMTRRQEV